VIGTKPSDLRSGHGSELEYAGEIVALSSEYHRSQAITLTQLARTTRDREAAQSLFRLAAEHIELADDVARARSAAAPPSNDNK
jgi:hypothetical protein